MVAKGLQHAALNEQYWVFRYCSYSPYGTVPAKAALHSKQETVYAKISIPKNTTIDSFIRHVFFLVLTYKYYVDYFTSSVM